MRGKRRLFWYVFMILSIPFWALPAQAAETERDTIRIAIPTPFSTGDGASGGSAYIDYTMGYLREIAQYTGWEYEVIQVPGTYEEGIQTALDMLCEGTADMVAPVQYRQNIQNGVYFSQHSYVTESTVLQIPNKVYQGQEIGEDLRVAVIQGSGMDTSAEPFFAKNGITAEYVFCQSIEEQTETVCSGRADVMLNSNLENVPNVSVVAEFLPQSLYFAAADQALLQELDNAIIYIRQANALFSMELYKENIMDSNQELTREESAFIEQQTAPYVVAVLEGNAPY